MDVHDVTAEYRDLIDQQMRTLQEAQKHQGKRPRDRKTKRQALEEFRVGRMSSQVFTLVHGRRDSNQIHTSFLPLAYLPCTTPMNQLSPIAIRDLQLETHHRGSYLLLRSITPPYRMTGIMALMEDKNDDAILLQLYQQEAEETRPTHEIVTIDTILLVKEPFFKRMGDGEYGVRVDHLSDVVHLEGDDIRIPEEWQPRIFELELELELERSAESLKIQGNSYMEEKKYWSAIKQ